MIPRVDPHARQGPLKRLGLRIANTNPGRSFGINVMTKVDPWIMRKTRGKVWMPVMFPVGLVTTTGAKSGKPRETPLVYFHDGDDIVLIASNFGRAKHPAWYHNLKRHPDFRITAGGETQEFTAREVEDPAERERLYGLAMEIFPGYGTYEEISGDRRIRVLRCSPRDPAGPPAAPRASGP